VSLPYKLSVRFLSIAKSLLKFIGPLYNEAQNFTKYWYLRNFSSEKLFVSNEIGIRPSGIFRFRI